MPLSEAEKERRSGRFLADLLAGAIKPAVRARGHLPDPADLPRRLVADGYPEPLLRSPVRARQWHRQYVRSIVDRDVLDVGRVRDADALGRLLSLLAGATASCSTRPACHGSSGSTAPPFGNTSRS